MKSPSHSPNIRALIPWPLLERLCIVCSNCYLQALPIVLV